MKRETSRGSTPSTPPWRERTPGDGCGCGAKAEVAVRTLRVDGEEVPISRLDSIMRVVRVAGLPSQAKERKELLRLVKAFNDIPPERERAVDGAIWREYRKGVYTADDAPWKTKT